MPVGFYYKSLFKPRLAWKIAEPLMRRLAGLGQLDAKPERGSHGVEENHHVELVVVGADRLGWQRPRRPPGPVCQCFCSTMKPIWGTSSLSFQTLLRSRWNGIPSRIRDGRPSAGSIVQGLRA